MGLKMFDQKLNFTPIITTVLTLAISIQTFAKSNRTGNWERDFYGTPSFNLGDDQRLNTLRHKTKSAKLSSPT